jgi:hypothetical protein
MNGMAHNRRDSNSPATAADVERLAAIMAELSFDLMRAIQAAVPIALHETLDGEVNRPDSSAWPSSFPPRRLRAIVSARPPRYSR